MAFQAHTLQVVVVTLQSIDAIFSNVASLASLTTACQSAITTIAGVTAQALAAVRILGASFALVLELVEFAGAANFVVGGVLGLLS